MSHLLDEVLAQAANGSPLTAAFSSEDVAVLMFASRLLESRRNWLDREFDPLDEVTDADWDEIEKLVGNLYDKIMNPLLGLIFPIVTDVVPTNCLLCDGSSYARVDYPNLYALLDPAFIVDADNFTVPDLRHRTVVGVDETAGSEYQVNAAAGSDDVTLSSGEMPSHYHGLFETTGLAVAPGELPILVPSFVALRNTDTAGGDGAHENRMPYRALNYVVVAQ